MGNKEGILCGYGCGQPWVPWAGTQLKGHAVCAASTEMQDDVYDLRQRFPFAPLYRIARDLGISKSVLVAWLTRAGRRRGRAA